MPRADCGSRKKKKKAGCWVRGVDTFVAIDNTSPNALCMFIPKKHHILIIRAPGFNLTHKQKMINKGSPLKVRSEDAICLSAHRPKVRVG